MSNSTPLEINRRYKHADDCMFGTKNSGMCDCGLWKRGREALGIGEAEDEHKIAVEYIERDVQVPAMKGKETRNSEVLAQFVAYCQAHPTERFWQALRNWVGCGFVYVSNRLTGDSMCADTFYWEERNKTEVRR